MYYEEKIINDILCYRLTPNGKWIEYSLESLSKKYMEIKHELNNLKKIHNGAFI